eukprot:gb/GEZN01006338.1/.p1 GENE.gb/GEZN01006338.1/~~gb/GEZN01006338.1/.p1  ORF type:complete len:345 (-),score=75.41 gb/GEZN01006338.1/:532-1566(-)
MSFSAWSKNMLGGGESTEWDQHEGEETTVSTAKLHQAKEEEVDCEGEAPIALDDEEETWETGDMKEFDRRLSLDTSGRRFSLFEDCEVIPTLHELQRTMETVGGQMQGQLDMQKAQISKLKKELKLQQSKNQAELTSIERQTEYMLQRNVSFVGKKLSLHADTIEGHDDEMAEQMQLITSHKDQEENIKALTQQVCKQRMEIERQKTEMKAQKAQSIELNKKTMDAMAAVHEVTEKMRQALMDQRNQIQQLHDALKNTRQELSQTQKTLKEQTKAHEEDTARGKVELSRLKSELQSKVALGTTFIIRSLNSTCIQAHQRFWKGEKMVIDRFEARDARDPEDWRD